MNEDEEFAAAQLEHGGETERSKKKKNKKRKKEKSDMSVEEPEPEPEPERIKATVKFIPEQPNKTPPLVGYFPSGYNPHEGGDGGEKPRVRVYRNANEKRKRMELVVSPRESSVEFVGTSYSGEAMAPQFCQYAVGVFDKKSQTLKVVPIASNKVKKFAILGYQVCNLSFY